MEVIIIIIVIIIVIVIVIINTTTQGLFTGKWGNLINFLLNMEKVVFTKI